jgi:hypothetical protein
MVWRHFCDECGSENGVAGLTISAEVSKSRIHMPELPEEPLYERDLCSSCRQVRITEFLDFLEKLKRRR